MDLLVERDISATYISIELTSRCPKREDGWPISTRGAYRVVVTSVSDGVTRSRACHTGERPHMPVNPTPYTAGWKRASGRVSLLSVIYRQTDRQAYIHCHHPHTRQMCPPTPTHTPHIQTVTTHTTHRGVGLHLPTSSPYYMCRSLSVKWCVWFLFMSPPYCVLVCQLLVTSGVWVWHIVDFEWRLDAVSASETISRIEHTVV